MVGDLWPPQVGVPGVAPGGGQGSGSQSDSDGSPPFGAEAGGGNKPIDIREEILRLRIIEGLDDNDQC